MLLNFIEEKVVPYVAEGCCHNRKCQFYRYQYYHKPTEGCLMWAEFQNKGKITTIVKFGSNFKIHEFMEYICILWRTMEMLPDKLPCPT